MESEKFCLRWNDFHTNISSAFKQIKDAEEFFDVTLACGEKQIQAHKVIIAACSSFFRNILKQNPHPHPLLYLRGVRFTDLQAVLDFMYYGEVNVAQEKLNSFLAIAEDLRVKGLTQNQSSEDSHRAEDQDDGKSQRKPDESERTELEDCRSWPAVQGDTDHGIIKSEPKEKSFSKSVKKVLPSTQEDEEHGHGHQNPDHHGHQESDHHGHQESNHHGHQDSDHHGHGHQDPDLKDYDDYEQFDSNQYGDQPTDLSLHGEQQVKGD